jgi:hypothetical protein
MLITFASCLDIYASEALSFSALSSSIYRAIEIRKMSEHFLLSMYDDMGSMLYEGKATE